MQPKPSTLSQLTASTILFLRNHGVEIPAELEVPFQQHLKEAESLKFSQDFSAVSPACYRNEKPKSEAWRRSLRRKIDRLSSQVAPPQARTA